jgi:hypothetical protein
MKRQFYAKDINDLECTLNQLKNQDRVHGMVLFKAESEQNHAPRFEKIIRAFPKAIFGGVFPGLIIKRKLLHQGFLIHTFDSAIQTQVIDLSTDSVDQQVRQIPSLKGKINTIFCLINNSSVRKNKLLKSIFDRFGEDVYYIGAEAGVESYSPGCSIFHNSGLYNDSAVITVLSEKISLGFAHGWTPASRPLKVTRSNGKKLVELDSQKASEVYRKKLQDKVEPLSKSDNLSALLHRFPIGMLRLHSEPIIRDVTKIHNGELMINEDLDEGAYIRIMHSTNNDLIQAAKSADQQAQNGKSGAGSSSLLFECVGRKNFLGQNFQDELDIFSSERELNGVLSLGEIANTGNSYLEGFNKTVVVTQWNSAK